MTEIQGKSILVRVRARFELARVRDIGSRLYLLQLNKSLYRKNLAKLKRVSNEKTWNQAKGLKYDERKKQRKKEMELAPPGFEPAPLLPPAQNVKPQTTGPCDQCAKYRKMPKITPNDKH